MTSTSLQAFFPRYGNAQLHLANPLQYDAAHQVHTPSNTCTIAFAGGSCPETCTELSMTIVVPDMLLRLARSDQNRHTVAMLADLEMVCGTLPCHKHCMHSCETWHDEDMPYVLLHKCTQRCHPVAFQTPMLTTTLASASGGRRLVSEVLHAGTADMLHQIVPQSRAAITIWGHAPSPLPCPMPINPYTPGSTQFS